MTDIYTLAKAYRDAERAFYKNALPLETQNTLFAAREALDKALNEPPDAQARIAALEQPLENPPTAAEIRAERERDARLASLALQAEALRAALPQIAARAAVELRALARAMLDHLDPKR